MSLYGITITTKQLGRNSCLLSTNWQSLTRILAYIFSENVPCIVARVINRPILSITSHLQLSVLFLIISARGKERHSPFHRIKIDLINQI